MMPSQMTNNKEKKKKQNKKKKKTNIKKKKKGEKQIVMKGSGEVHRGDYKGGSGVVMRSVGVYGDILFLLIVCIPYLLSCRWGVIAFRL
jgi:hypothetical protein